MIVFSCTFFSNLLLTGCPLSSCDLKWCFGQSCYLMNIFQHLAQQMCRCYTTGSPLTCAIIAWSVERKFSEFSDMFSGYMKGYWCYPSYLQESFPFFHGIRPTTYLVNIYFRKHNSAGKETLCVQHWKDWNSDMFEGRN